MGPVLHTCPVLSIYCSDLVRNTVELLLLSTRHCSKAMLSENYLLSAWDSESGRGHVSCSKFGPLYSHIPGRLLPGSCTSWPYHFMSVGHSS